MANLLLDRLRAKDKKGLFVSSQTSISYPTGFLPFDYRNGYIIQSRGMDETLLGEYSNTGIAGGSFITIIGKSGTAKTTFASQISANIIRKFDNGMVIHFDLEQALSYTRIKNITNLTQKQLSENYILRQDKNFIEDIFDTIEEIVKEKEENKKDYMYDTGLHDEFNNPIIEYVPTIIIIDSIPTMASRDTSKEMEGSTYANRVAKALAQFYRRMIPVIKAFNIMVIAINHINTKMEINPMMKTQPQLLYMKMDESLPGGGKTLNLTVMLSDISFNCGELLIA